MFDIILCAKIGCKVFVKIYFDMIYVIFWLSRIVCNALLNFPQQKKRTMLPNSSSSLFP